MSEEVYIAQMSIAQNQQVKSVYICGICHFLEFLLQIFLVVFIANFCTFSIFINFYYSFGQTFFSSFAICNKPQCPLRSLAEEF